MSRGAKDKDLFESLGGPAADPNGRVDLIMVVVRDSDRAFLLRRADRRGAEPQWVPKSQVTRDAPPDDDIFAMARWVAAEREWL